MANLNDEQQKHQADDTAVSEEIVTPTKIAWRRLKKNKLAILGFIILILLAFGAVFAPYLTPYEWNETNVLNTNAEPDSEHILGTDSMGRDTLTRVLYGGRVSLTVGLVATGMIILIGTLAGGVAGYYGGTIDNIIMRIADVFISMPFLPLAITMVAIFGASIYNIMLVIGILGWPSLARLVRGEILSLKEQEFMEAARALGIKDRNQIFRHLLPNTMAPIIVNGTLAIASAILLEAMLSFLGMGVNPPTPTWGNMLNAAQSMYVLQHRWWLWVPPGIAIFVAVMSLNLVGDALRDALDPRLKE